MLIIPSIDILKGKVVRLAQGDFSKVTYYDFQPIEQAKEFEAIGYKRLHIVDLMGSKCGEITTLRTIDEIKKNTKLKLQFGGGIRTYHNVKILLDHGVDKVVIGSMAVSDKPEFERTVADFGADSVIIAADAYEEKVRIKGWTEDSGISIYDHIEYCRSLGIKEYLSTDIKMDGMLEGPSTELYKKIMDKFPDINVIASGGVSTKENIKNLKESNLFAAIIGRAFYENKLDPKEILKIGK